MVIVTSSIILISLAAYIALVPRIFPFKAKLAYEGDGTLSPELGRFCRNWFYKGEVARLEFEVQNPYFKDIKVDVYLAPFDDLGSRRKIYEFQAERSRLLFPSISTQSLEIDTYALNSSLYELQVFVEGLAKYTSPTLPSSNIESYPWMLCVMERLNLSTADRGCDGIPELVVPCGLGVNIHFVKPSPSQEIDLDMMANAGFRLIRMDLTWDNVEKERGVYDFSDYEVLTEELEKRGIRPLYILDYGNSLYDEGLPPHTDEGRGAFATFATAAVREFGDDRVIWEIWNEPNIEVFWKPSPNVTNYAMLAIEASRRMREAEGNCTIIAPATSGIDRDFIYEAMRLGLSDRLSALSVHPYRPSEPETVFGEYENLREIVGNLTVVSSEWGYTTNGPYGNRVDLITQAQYIVRIYLTNLMQRVPISIIYDWKDDGLSQQDSEQNFGVVANHDGSARVLGFECFYVKPSYFALYNLVRELCGFSPEKEGVFGEGIYGLWFTKGDDRKLVVWTGGDQRIVEIKMDSASVRAIRIFGMVESIDPIDGVFKVNVSGSPTIICPQA